MTVDPHLSLIGKTQRPQNLQKGCLSGSAGAHYGVNFPGRHFQINAPKDLEIPE